ncbi:MAG: S8 family peptidase, partial [Candidatus Thermoplasmatota archaeon]|nr:S8 family peptidase [Candidatus Thermoplasmatota archaeon]
VSSKYGNEKFTWNRKDCTVKVHNWQTEQDQHSMKIFSWAYANGTMRVVRTISFPRNKAIKNLNIISKELFNQNLKNKLNKIFGLFFSNVLNNQNKEKNDDKNIKNFRDFDLDELIKKVKSEEEKYESYDVEYREYKPGLPRNPSIVYYGSNQVIVGFKSYVDINKIDEVEGFPIVDRLVELNTVVVEIYGIEPTDFMEIVYQSQDVEYTELNYVYQRCYIPNDPLWDEQWGLKAIKCPQAWDKQKGHWTVNVAILDTGCNYLHEDISKKQSSANYDFINNDNDPMDDCIFKHGTHCAGIIGATIDNHKGIAGAAPNVWTDYIKVLDSNGMGFASTIAKGIIHATKYDDRIISMSLGGYGVSMLLHLACDYARYIKGVVLVAAAGNDGLPILCYPARFNSVISVGAVDESLNLCSWSNYGPNLDLVAPGDNIISTVEGNKYMKLSGTSMATPHVAAVAALYFSANLKSTATLCENKLFSTTIDLGSPGNDWKYGYGLVNAYGAVTSSRSINNNNQLIRFIPKIQFLLGEGKLCKILRNILLL